MFFDDIDLSPRSKALLKQLPATPDTGWVSPPFYPTLRGVVHAGVDWETKETDFDRGPGWARGKGHIVGRALNLLYADGSEYSGYFPTRHEVDTHLNLDETQVSAFFADVLALDCDKSAANSQYEHGYASETNSVVNGLWHDPQVAEALLTEGGNVALDSIAQKWLGIGKETDLGYQWSAEAYGGEATSGQRANIYRWSPRLAGPYAMQDARLPRLVLSKQWRPMRDQGLLDLYRMENDFTPLLVEMRKKGVLIDLDKVEQMKARTTIVINEKYSELHTLTGLWFHDSADGESVRSADALAMAFNAVGVEFPRTETKSDKYPEGNPSFRKEWLKNVDHPLAELILDIREHLTLRDTFLQSYLLEGNINGRVHCQFHPLKGEEKGTRSGRFSSSTPNLQNIPSRTVLGKEIRECFIPERDHLCWQKDDYSQIEYRFLMHYAVDNLGTKKRPIYADGPSSDAGRAAYNADPKTDYHQSVYYRVCDVMGWDKTDKALEKEKRPYMKNTNFGLVYAMGRKKLARQLGLSGTEADKFFEAYHSANAYVQATMNWASDEAQSLGFITTIAGRRSRFDLWEPDEFPQPGADRPPGLEYDQAIRFYGYRIKRASTHKAINRRLQGSAADLLKMAMWICWKSGIYAVTGVPRLTVHDELDFSVIDDSPRMREAFREMHHIMETAIRLRVPVRVETERGPNWGKVKPV